MEESVCLCIKHDVMKLHQKVHQKVDVNFLSFQQQVSSPTRTAYAVVFLPIKTKTQK